MRASTPCVLLAALLAAGAARAQDTDAELARATRFLETIQENMHRELGSKPRVYDRAFMRRVAENYLKAQGGDNLTEAQREQVIQEFIAVLDASKLRSKYEDVAGFQIVERLNQKIRAVLADAKIRLPGVPVFGTLPTRQVNARTFAVPGTGNVVIAFEDQLFTFALLFSKAVAYAFPETPGSGGRLGFSTDIALVRKRLDESPVAVERMVEVLSAYLVTGQPGRAPQYFQAAPHSRIAEILLEGMELFVLGHEYGHFLANHVKEGREARAVIGDAEVTEILRNWNDEFEADRYGLRLSVATMRRDGLDVALSYWGAELFFTTFDIVERALHVLRTGAEPPRAAAVPVAKSHPPPALRRERLREAVKQAYGKEEAASALQLGESMQEAVEAVWEKARPAFVEAHKAGQRPHASWDRVAGR